MSTAWHSIRPWNPPLTLSVREITSVSVTFILSATPSGEADSLLAGLGIDPAELEQEEENDEEMKKTSVVANALASGLSVQVDRSSWRRVFIRIDEKTDEAVIIIYALMPGRQYDVDLELVHDGQKLERRVMTTQETEQAADMPEASSSSDQAYDGLLSTPSSSPSPATPPSTSPGFTPLTLDDRLNQLQHTLSVMSAERESLVATLKHARRDAQKADSAVRSEIDALKRASEKIAMSEHRARQKVLALQESVKRAQSTTKDREEEVKEIEKLLPELIALKDKREKEYKKVKAEADRVQRQRDQEKENERKRIEAMNNELAGLTHKFEKLQVRKEKLEGTVIPDLEEQLRLIEQEVEVEQAGYDFARTGYFGERGPWGAPPRHAQRSSSVHHTKTPVLFTNPHRQSSLKATNNSHSNSSSGSLASQPVVSTLSSKAPVFEPGKPIRHMWNAT
ncbi:hypothetical protein CYLTODRAFT_418920 [Cylindrobasidium torrendii FP15055 ss-10]|uniref:Uncharacterized protein n=1 Tax=Cylindrobasidium torrendii FP15055 ss-10 TaxID=1314674 RepID=A0A0D7BLE7_9AGAR|nr:hypothetical protein CYLTODRAFT_418920 [Cylindrobasidium torrendii FP15055 ss-10]